LRYADAGGQPMSNSRILDQWQARRIFHEFWPLAGFIQSAGGT
jgi:hypothetical protein